MSNFGIGIGSFMGGLSQGIDVGEKALGVYNRRKGQQVTANAAEAARSRRNADINGSVVRGAVGSPDGPVPTYEVGGRQFGDEQSAMAEAERKAGALNDYYFQETMPQLQQHYMEIGEPDKAFAIGKAMEDDSFRKGAASWARAATAHNSGDMQGFLKNYVEAYNSRGYFDDGMTAKGIEPINNEAGDVLGYKITLVDRDGKETTQDFTGDDIGRQSLRFLEPGAAIAAQVDMHRAGQTARAEMAGEERKFQRDVQLKQFDQGLGIQRDGNRSQLRMAEEADKRASGGDSTKVREANAMANALRQAGWPDDKVKAEMPRLLGIYRQSQSPTDRLASTVEMLAKADLDYAGLPDTEKVSRAKALMDTMDQELAQAEGAQQQPAAVPSQGKGVTVWTR